MRSFLSVLAGAVLWSALWLTSAMTLQAAMPGSFRPDGSTDSVGLLLLMLVLACAFHVLAGYLTAAIARRRETARALALGILQLTIGIGVQIGYWDVMPLWYHLIFLAAILPSCVIGGRIRRDRVGPPIAAPS